MGILENNVGRGSVLEAIVYGEDAPKVVMVNGLEIPLDAKRFYFDNLRRSYNGRFKEKDCQAAYDEESKLVDEIIKPEEISFSLDNVRKEETEPSHSKIEVLFQFLQLAEFKQHAYFLSEQKSRYVTIDEAEKDYSHLDCEQKTRCSQCPRQNDIEVCCFSKAYRRQFEHDQKGTLTYHTLLQMHNEEIVRLKDHFGISYEDALKKFALEPIKLIKDGKETTRARLFYENFQKQGKQNLEGRYLLNKAIEIDEIKRGRPVTTLEDTKRIVYELVPAD